METKQVIRRLILARFTPHGWYGSAKSEQGRRDLEEKHGAKSIHVTAKYLPEKYAKPLRKARDEMRAYWNANTLPWQDGGWRVLPVDRCQRVMDKMAEMIAGSWRLATQAIIMHYDEIKAAAQADLNGLFDARRFPARDYIEECYRAEISRAPVTLPDDVRIEGMDKVALDEIKKEVAATNAEQMRGALLALLGRLSDMLAEIVDRMNQDPKKTRYNSLITRTVRPVLESAAALNITHDPKLAELIDSMKGTLGDIHAETLKASKGARATVKKYAQEFAEKVTDAMAEVERMVL